MAAISHRWIAFPRDNLSITIKILLVGKQAQYSLIIIADYIRWGVFYDI